MGSPAQPTTVQIHHYLIQESFRLVKPTALHLSSIKQLNDLVVFDHGHNTGHVLIQLLLRQKKLRDFPFQVHPERKTLVKGPTGAHNRSSGCERVCKTQTTKRGRARLFQGTSLIGLSQSAVKWTGKHVPTVRSNNQYRCGNLSELSTCSPSKRR